MISTQIHIQKNKPKMIAILLILICLIFFGRNSTGSWNLKAEPDEATSDTAATYNNLANLYLLQSELDSTKLDTAISYYQEAIKRDTSDGGIKLNLAIAYLVKGDTVAADSCFSEGLSDCDSNLAKAFFLLTIDFDSEKEMKGMPGDVTKGKIIKRLKKAAAKLRTKKQSAGKSKKSPASTGSAARRTSRPAGPRHLNPGDVKKYLYWKY